jgi:hypothetical protein
MSMHTARSAPGSNKLFVGFLRCSTSRSNSQQLSLQEVRVPTQPPHSPHVVTAHYEPEEAYVAHLAEIFLAQDRVAAAT